MNRPISITIIGVIFIIAGCLAAWDIANDLFQERWNLNFGVLMTPVGVGLLRGRSSSLGWAKFWVGLFSLVCALTLVLYPFFGDSYSVTWNANEQLVGFPRHAMVIGLPLVLLFVATLMWRSLSSPACAGFFDDHRIQETEHAVSGNRQ